MTFETLNCCAVAGSLDVHDANVCYKHDMCATGLSLELELGLAIKCGALRRGYACLAALLAGCTDRVLLSRFTAWTGRDKDPDAPEPLPGEIDEDPFGKASQSNPGAPAGAPKVRYRM